MITKSQIENFLSLRTLAVAGVSRNPKKFGNTLYNELVSKGYNVIPLNPEMKEYNGVPCYANLNELSSPPEGLVITINKNKTLDILKNAVQKGIKNIWIQQMSENKESIEYCKQNNVNVIYGKCLLMFLEPVESIHKFHRFLSKIFGRLPK